MTTPVQNVYVQKSPTNVLGILSIIFGSITWFFAIIPVISGFAIPFAVVSLLLGVIGLFVKRPRATAIVGSVISLVALVLATLMTALVFG